MIFMLFSMFFLRTVEKNKIFKTPLPPWRDRQTVENLNVFFN